MDLITDEPREHEDAYDEADFEPTDVVGKRVGAFLVDLTICVLALVGPLLFFGATFSSPRLEERSPDISQADGDVAIFARDRAIVFAEDELFLTAGVAGLTALLVFVVLPAFTGASPGKAVGDIRVVREDGRRPGLVRSLVRTLLWVIDGLPGLPLVGFAVARFTRRHQRVGDLVARTYVVDKAHYGHPLDGHPLDAPFAGSDAEGPDWTEEAAPAAAASVGGASVGGASVFGDSDPAALDEAPTEGDAAPAASAWAPAASAAAATPAEPEPEPEPEPEREPEPAPRAASPVADAGEGERFKADEPVWDKRRRTYIMYDSRRSAWLGWDDQSNEWRQLGGGNG